MVQATAITHQREGDSPVNEMTTVVSRKALGWRDLVRVMEDREAPPAKHVARFRLDFTQRAEGDPVAAIEAVRELYARCGRCHLSDRRQRVSFVKGNPHALLAVIGEAPGQQENHSGKVFCGPSGRFQDELFKECGIDPLEQVAWLNLAGCRPADSLFSPDRPPSLVEKLACSERTFRLLSAIRPRIVLCLGKEAAGYFWSGDKPPENSARKLTPQDAPEDWVQVVVARHPAYLIRSAQANYGEYFAAKLTLRKIGKLLREVDSKPRVWRFVPKYVQELGEAVVGW